MNKNLFWAKAAWCGALALRSSNGLLDLRLLKLDLRLLKLDLRLLKLGLQFIKLGLRLINLGLQLIDLVLCACELSVEAVVQRGDGGGGLGQLESEAGAFGHGIGDVGARSIDLRAEVVDGTFSHGVGGAGLVESTVCISGGALLGGEGGGEVGDFQLQRGVSGALFVEGVARFVEGVRHINELTLVALVCLIGTHVGGDGLRLESLPLADGIGVGLVNTHEHLVALGEGVDLGLEGRVVCSEGGVDVLGLCCEAGYLRGMGSDEGLLLSDEGLLLSDEGLLLSVEGKSSALAQPLLKEVVLVLENVVVIGQSFEARVTSSKGRRHIDLPALRGGHGGHGGGCAEVFLHRSFLTQMFFYTDHRCFFTQMFFYTDVFLHRRRVYKHTTHEGV